jgi:hypothetical protein
MWRVLIALIALIAVIASTPAVSASLDGVQMADTLMVEGKAQRLNGMAVRTWAVPFIHIYVAGLYLERPSGNGDEILKSPQLKLLQFAFVRSVEAEDIRDAWRTDFARYCRTDCRVPNSEISAFLDAMPAMQAGDSANFVFDPSGLEVTLNGRRMGRIPDQEFAHLLLAVFIGPSPAFPKVKEALLGNAR